MNTDQDSQFTSAFFIEVLEQNGIKISMDGQVEENSPALQVFQAVFGEDRVPVNEL